MPAHAGIQYAAASRLKHSRFWNTGSPAFAGDDGARSTVWHVHQARAGTGEDGNNAAIRITMTTRRDTHASRRAFRANGLQQPGCCAGTTEAPFRRS